MKNIMNEAVIVAAGRTATGKAPGGSLRNTRPEDMGCAVLDDLLKRAGGLDPMIIDDVIMGCTFPESIQGLNIARVLVMSMGWPDRIPGMTINRFCSSGLQAIAIGAERIMCGSVNVVLAGGIEHMSRIPMVGSLPYPNPALVENRPGSFTGMGLTAENVAEKYGISRDEQDEFAVLSQQKAAAAAKRGRFRDQIIPLNVRIQKEAADGRFKHDEKIFSMDEGIRSDTTKEKISRLPAVFKKNGTVTAANSSQTGDGAAGVILMSRKKADEMGLEPLAVFRSFAVEGCPPEYMGVGPLIAVPKLLKMTGTELKDIGLIELNEAFAAQAVHCIRELDLNPELTNVNGGAIALGHPLGCTGAKLTTQLVYEMIARKVQYGIVTMCVGFGMGAAALFEVENISR